jgi:hypothetical protein
MRKLLHVDLKACRITGLGAPTPKVAPAPSPARPPRLFPKKTYRALCALHRALYRTRRPRVIPSVPLVAAKDVDARVEGRVQRAQRRGLTTSPRQGPEYWGLMWYRDVRLVSDVFTWKWIHRRQALFTLTEVRRIMRKQRKRARKARHWAYLQHLRATDPVYAAMMDDLEASERWWNEAREKDDLPSEASWQYDYEADDD